MLRRAFEATGGSHVQRYLEKGREDGCILLVVVAARGLVVAVVNTVLVIAHVAR